MVAGRVFLADIGLEEVESWTVRSEDVEEEIQKLVRAIADAVAQLRDSRDRVLHAAGEADARIFDFHAHLLEDPSALEAMRAWIREERLSAEAAVVRFTEASVQRFKALDPEDLRSVGSDIQDAFRRVRSSLQRIEREGLRTGPGEGVILVAENLTPSLTTMLPRERVLAIVTERGGKFSHGAVLVRSLNIPTVIGVRGIAKDLSAGDEILVDGEEGTIEMRPDAPRRRVFLEEKQRYDDLQAAMARTAHREARTKDGERIQILVNIESLRELSTFDPGICDGVGLCRTEFIYQERREFPSEDEQVHIYSSILETMQGRPVVFRTLDVGNDKRLPFFSMPQEANPALGWRGLRISLHWRDLFLVQLRALLRAAANGPARILLPMVTTPEEVHEVRALLAQVESDLEQEGVPFGRKVPLGVMIEVPAAIYGLPLYAPWVNFLSIGTNDLVQYLLAVDRDNKWVASMYEPYHPVILRALDDILRAAAEHDLPISVCGEMAGMVDSALVLAALGLRSFSIAPRFIPEIKLIVNQVKASELADLREAILARTTPGDVRIFLETLIEGLRIAALEDLGPRSGDAPR
ncbi:MAG: phosphoenolpyruvate--protein phosphotransferase [Planctomycetes bacterium]|nr:phosphoenolpyruvate--protein phosphotransferase [Planctomycetota bacterium]